MVNTMVYLRNQIICELDKKPQIKITENTHTHTHLYATKQWNPSSDKQFWQLTCYPSWSPIVWSATHCVALIL